MWRPSASSAQRKYRGIMLLELVLMLAIMAIFAVISYSAVFNYYRTSIIDSELQSVVSFIHRTRQQAIGNPTGQAYSMKFLPASYVVFPGTVYVSGSTENESHALNVGVVIDTSYTSDVIIFDNFTGRTGEAGTITISAFGFNKVININSLGIVEDIQ